MFNGVPHDIKSKFNVSLSIPLCFLFLVGCVFVVPISYSDLVFFQKKILYGLTSKFLFLFFLSRVYINAGVYRVPLNALKTPMSL